MSKKKLSKEELALLQFVVSNVSAAVVKKHKGVAAKDFNKCAKSQEMVKLLSDLAAAKAPQKAKDIHKQSKQYIDQFESMLPMILMMVGEDKILASLPKQAGTTPVIQLCEHLGAKNTANLCRKKAANGPK